MGDGKEAEGLVAGFAGKEQNERVAVGGEEVTAWTSRGVPGVGFWLERLPADGGVRQIRVGFGAEEENTRGTLQLAMGCERENERFEGGVHVAVIETCDASWGELKLAVRELRDRQSVKERLGQI